MGFVRGGRACSVVLDFLNTQDKGRHHVVLAVLSLALLVQQPPPPVTSTIVTAHAWVARLGREMGDSIWPGFRPDTIPVLYVVKGQGTLVLGWPGALPAGFIPFVDHPDAGWQSSTDPGAASTGTELAGQRAAQVVVSDSQDIASLVGLTTHEAFHVFEAASKKEGMRFGQGENSFLVTSYPVFDPQNEAGMALEGRILAAAEVARTKAERRALARQFLAVRESRQRALGAERALPGLAHREELASQRAPLRLGARDLGRREDASFEGHPRLVLGIEHRVARDKERILPFPEPLALFL